MQSSPRIMINEFLYFVLELFLQILAFVSRDAVNDKHSFFVSGGSETFNFGLVGRVA